MKNISGESNIFTISESDLLKKYYLLKPKKNETYKPKDIIIINKENKNKIKVAEISGANYLVRKYMDIIEIPETYRRK